MPTMILIEEARAKRTCGYCGESIPKGARLLRVALNLWNKHGTSTGGTNICGRCLTALTLELNGMGPVSSLSSSPHSLSA